MSATAVGEKFQVTLPQDVREAAGLRINDQVDWRFEDGEIRGRKLVLEPELRRMFAKLVRKDGRLVFETKDVKITAEAIATAIREERDGH